MATLKDVNIMHETIETTMQREDQTKNTNLEFS